MPIPRTTRAIHSLVPAPIPLSRPFSHLHFFTLSHLHFSLFTLHCLVFQITFSTNSPLFGVQSNETNQLDRFLFARESMFSTKNSAKENLLMPKK